MLYATPSGVPYDIVEVSGTRQSRAHLAPMEFLMLSPSLAISLAVALYAPAVLLLIARRVLA